MRKRRGKKPRPPWQKRVIAERAAIDRKIIALEKFMFLGKQWETLPRAEQDRLRIQCQAMNLYSTTLSARIEVFQ